MKAAFAFAFILLVTLANSSFVENKLRRNVAIKAINTQDFLTGVLLAMRFVEKVPDAYVCSANVDELNSSIITAKTLIK
jgi:Ni,Fe-hydrogenase I cytochrome b subunit